MVGESTSLLFLSIPSPSDGCYTGGMDDDRPKVAAWNYDTANDPTFDPTAQPPATYSSATADNMLRDTTTHFRTKWLLRSSVLTVIAIVIWFVSPPLGLLAAAGICFNLTRVIALDNASPSKISGVIATSLVGLTFVVFAILYFIHHN